MIIKTSEIRKTFLEFYQKNDHKLVPSSPVIPYDDPTILFINAGMNQFKDVFTGKRKVDYKRATSSQKCIRAGGKHNDLDNVGFTSRHHTFFEMLGNFSFGDYFKEEAIKLHWELFTKVLGLPVDRLYASVYETDDEAFELWEKIAPELKNGRILRFGKKDNFWSMGNIGPCGPCSEIHIDRGEKYGVGPEHVVNGETDRFVEIGNLVFMQYDQLEDGTVVDLPNPSVDTGTGLERLAAVMQDVPSNYNIDLFKNIINAIEEIAKDRYKGDLIPSFHVVADHLRALTFAIADGAGISNEGQGYVLRRILRRAARHGRLLGNEEPFIYKLVPTLAKEMGDVYPEISEKENHIVNVIKAEEESFGRTLETGLELFEKLAKSSKGGTIDGAEVFKLYDTYGFPYDLTELMASEKGLKLDQTGFDKAMEEQKTKSRAGASFAASSNITINYSSDTPTEFVRDRLVCEAKLLHYEKLDDENYAVVLMRTPFYVESGGQVSDRGVIFTDMFTFEVESMHKQQDIYIHVGKLTKGSFDNLELPTVVTAQVKSERRWHIMRNHTVTHLTHKALRTVLGDHIKQSGSYVGPDRMRFDFSHHQPMTDEEIENVEKIVNDEILKATPVKTEEMNIEDAKKSGAMALFGEKYDDDVRVVSVGNFSKELCGGTHVDNVAQIGPFFITLETGIASGVRRIEAITGAEAIKYMLNAKAYRKEVAKLVNRPETESLAGVESLKEQNSQLSKELKKVKAEMFSGGSSSVGDEQKIGDIKFVTNDFGDTDRDIMASWVDSQKEKNEPIFVIALGMVNDKRTYLAASSQAALDKKVKAGDITKELLPIFGGRGGGKPNFAQGSVDNETDADELFAKAAELIKNKL